MQEMLDNQDNRFLHLSMYDIWLKIITQKMGKFSMKVLTLIIAVILSSCSVISTVELAELPEVGEKFNLSGFDQGIDSPFRESSIFYYKAERSVKDIKYTLLIRSSSWPESERSGILHFIKTRDANFQTPAGYRVGDVINKKSKSQCVNLESDWKACGSYDEGEFKGKIVYFLKY